MAAGVPMPGATLDPDAIRTACREHLAGYKLPRAVVFVDRTLRSPSGKPDYRWARTVAESATPADADHVLETIRAAAQA